MAVTLPIGHGGHNIYVHFRAVRRLKALGGSWNNAERCCGRNSSASMICSKESLHKTIREWQSYLRTLDGVYGTIGMQGSLGQ